MDSETMDLDNQDNTWIGWLYSILLGIATYLSRHFHFSFTSLVYDFTHFSLSVWLGSLMDIDVHLAAKYIDAFFHYTLLTLTLCFTSLKFWDYCKKRKKI